METMGISERSSDAVGAADTGDAYDVLVAMVKTRFLSFAEKGPLFVAKVEGLYEAYLDVFDGAIRQHHTCRACGAFLKNYGALVSIDEDGKAVSALWDPKSAPAAYRPVVHALKKIVEQGSIEGVFLTDEDVLGRPSTRTNKGVTWTHFNLSPRGACAHKKRDVKTAFERAAEKREEHGMLGRSIGDFSAETAAIAERILTDGFLYRSEKCIGVAKWFRNLHDTLAGTKNTCVRDNLLWRAVALAPPGYAHVRSSMIGTLLEDLSAGKSMDEAKSAFDAKMDPRVYQRPQAAPTAGNIYVAEQLIDKLGTRRSFERRFALLADVQTIWRPKKVEEKTNGKGGGMFDHIVPKGAAVKTNGVAKTGAAPVVMTFAKFRRDVLPTAEKIEFQVPYGALGYTAMVTALHADAPPVVQWDREDRRNPVTWYTYVNGSHPSQWNLREGTRAEVTAVVLQPSMWGEDDGKLAHQGQSAMFALKGSYDSYYKKGAGLFPELLKSEYREVRASLEAFIREYEMTNVKEAEVCGPRIGGNSRQQAMTFHVLSRGVESSYTIDRWD